MQRSRKGASEELARRYGDAPAEIVRARIKVVRALFVFLAVVIVARLMQLHLNPSLNLTQEEEAHIGQIELREPRGEIYSANRVLLAGNDDVPSLWADPRAVENPEALAKLLHERLGLDYAQTLGRLTQRDEKGNLRKFVWLERWLDESRAKLLDGIVAESEDALSVEHESVRRYPQGEMAAHILGFVNRAGEASEGVELAYNKYLYSVPGKHLARKDGRRNLLPSLTLELTQPKGGDDVILTLDTNIQGHLEAALDKRIVECKARGAMGIVMNPETGAILAMTTRPSFDPNQYATATDAMRNNHAVIDTFEPGSAFKIVAAAAAIELGLITPETVFNCEGGAWNPYGHTVRDFHRMGSEPFSKCFEESSNIAHIKVGAMLGPERMDEWIRRFGFGKPTSRDFSVESRGIYRPREKWSKLSMGSLPMGQEIAVTMPQIARAFAVIANGGYLVEPHVVDRVKDRNGNVVYKFEPRERPRVLSESTVHTMRELCHLVVAHGTGQPAIIPEYRAGGKTGTAQVAGPRGGYLPGKFTCVFAGFAPVADPKLVCVIVVQEPDIALHFGGYVSGPVFKEVVRDALIDMHIARDPMHDGKADPNAVKLAEEIDADTIVSREALALLESNEGKLDLMQPMAGVEPDAAAKDGSASGPALPDFKGYSKRQAREKLAQLGIPWDPRGAGWVLTQDPPAGTPLNQVRLCALEFGPRQAPPPREDETKRHPKNTRPKNQAR